MESKTMIDKMIALFITSMSLLVGVSTYLDSFPGAGLILFGCAACFIGGVFILIELSVKGAR